MRWATVREGDRITRFDIDRLSMVSIFKFNEWWSVGVRQPEGYVVELDFLDETEARAFYDWVTGALDNPTRDRTAFLSYTIREGATV